MMEQFIHISSDMSLPIGSVFDNRSWDRSYYFEAKYNFSRTGGTERNIELALRQKYSDRTVFSNEDAELLVSAMLPLNTELQLKAELLKEMIFENVRQKVSPNLPSRYNCLFLSNSGMTVDEVLNVYNFDRTASNKAIYKFQNSNVGNILHAADPKYLNCNSQPPQTIERFAQEYWEGKVTNLNAPLEILAIGRFTVVEKLNWPNP